MDNIYENKISDIKFSQKESVFFYNSFNKDYKVDNIAAFDLDWTLSYSQKHLFPKEEDDIHILPNRRETLIDLIDRGFTLVIFTNQYSKSKKEKLKKVGRVTTFINKINLPMMVFISTEKDCYRKPEIGMYKMFLKMIKELPSNIIYIGDALGRPQDFSDSDRLFGEAISSSKIYAPEDMFPSTLLPIFESKKEIVIFVGAPGTGKSSFYMKNLEKTHIYICQDILKTKANVLKLLKKSILTGKSIVIDSTNPLLETREVYYNLAKEYDYNIKVLYFARDGYGFNKLRENPVPDICYHIFFKKLEAPTEENTPGELIIV